MDEKLILKRLETFSSAYRQSDAFFSAIELGLFDCARENFKSPQQIGIEAKASPRRLKILLDLLCFYNLFDRKGGKYRVSADLLDLTDPAREDRLQRRFAHMVFNSRSWRKMSEVMRADIPASKLLGSEPGSDAKIQAFHHSLGSKGMLQAEELFKDVELPKAARILDVGGGFGDLCRPLLRRYPDAKAFLFDAPPTAKLAAEHHRELNLQDRFEIIAGDFIEDDIPDEGYDLIILSSILHIYDTATNRALLRRLYLSANDDGQILVREIAINDNRDGPQSGLEFAVNMAINTDGGDAYPASVVETWMKDGGWYDVTPLQSPSTFLYALLGRKSR